MNSLLLFVDDMEDLDTRMDAGRSLPILSSVPGAPRQTDYATIVACERCAQYAGTDRRYPDTRLEYG